MGGEASAPAWVPAYPGAKPQGTFTRTSERGEVNLTATRNGDSTVVTVQYEEKK